MNFLRQSWQKIRDLIGQMSRPQLTALSALVLTGLISLIWLLSWSTRSATTPLFYRALEPRMHADVVAKLDTLKIPYELKSGLIYVPAKMKEQTTVKLAREKDIQLYGKDPWKWLYDSDWTSTEQKTREKILRTNEARLEVLLREWPRIADARVIMTPGDPNRTFAKEKPAKASVSLALKGSAPLPPETVVAIANLVSGAVRDLDPSAVKVTDGYRMYVVPKDEGEFAGGTASDRMRLKEAYEVHEARKIQRALGPIGEVAYVSVDLEIDMQTIKRETRGAETDEPSMERKEKSEKTKVRPPGDTPGVSINVEDGKSKAAQPKEMEKKTVTEIRRDNQRTKTEQVTIPAGAITRKRVSVTVPYKLAGRTQAGVDPADESEADQNIKANLTRWKAGILALGYSDEDVVLTADAPIRADVPLEPGVTTVARDYLTEYGPMAFFSLLLLFAIWMVTRNLKQAMPQPLDALMREEQELVDKQLRDLMEGKIPLKFDEQSASLRTRIQEHIAHNPRGAALFISRWAMRE